MKTLKGDNKEQLNLGVVISRLKELQKQDYSICGYDENTYQMEWFESNDLGEWIHESEIDNLIVELSALNDL